MATITAATILFQDAVLVPNPIQHAFVPLTQLNKAHRLLAEARLAGQPELGRAKTPLTFAANSSGAWIEAVEHRLQESFVDAGGRDGVPDADDHVARASGGRLGGEYRRG